MLGADMDSAQMWHGLLWIYLEVLHGKDGH
jgi:hypothetical protein